MNAQNEGHDTPSKMKRPGLRGVIDRFVWNDLEDADDDIRVERAKVLVAQTISGEVVAIAVTLAYATIYVPAVGLLPYLVWLGLMVAAFEVRRILCKRLLPVSPGNAPRVLKVVAVTTWVLAFIITAPALVWLGELSGTQQAFVTSLQLVWVVTGVSIIGIAPRTYQIYMLLSLAPVLAGSWLWTHERSNLPLITVGVGLGSVVLWRIAGSLGKSISDTVAARTQNRALVERLEVALAQASELQAARSRFLASASHDLLQPIQTLLLLAPMVESTVDPARRKELGHQLSATVVSIDGMFRGFLEFARIEVGAITPKLSTIDLRPVLQRVAATLQTRCDAKGLTLHVSLPDQPQFAKIDVVLLDRVLQNIADNAVKYTAAGTVRLGLKAGDSTAHLVITVEDTGVGISTEDRGEVGKPFFRGAASVQQDVPGTGLGLANSHLLLGMMAGVLDLQPSVSGGCLATVILPKATMAAKHMPPTVPALQTAVKFRRIALLEDDSGVRQALTLLLEAQQCEVVSAATGSSMRAHFDRGFLPDFMIADYSLADKETGIEAIEKALARFAGLPVALVSGSVVDLALLPKGVKWLPKPIDHGQLLSLLSGSKSS